MKKQKQQKVHSGKNIAIIVVVAFALLLGFGAILEFNTGCQRGLAQFIKDNPGHETAGIYVNPKRCFFAKYNPETFFALESDNKEEGEFVFFHPVNDEARTVDVYGGFLQVSRIHIDTVLLSYLQDFDTFVESRKEAIFRRNEGAVIVSEGPRDFMGVQGYEIVYSAMVNDRMMKSFAVYAIVDDPKSTDFTVYHIVYMAEDSNYEQHLVEAQKIIDSARHQAY